MSSNLKSTILKGTLILTLSSLLTKVLGFFNRIFLSTTIGAKELGIYQLIFPIYLLVYSFTCQGLNLGIMKFMSEQTCIGTKQNAIRYFKVCALTSLYLSIGCMIIVILFHENIAIHILKQPECSRSLFILSFVFPVCSVKESILSYYYAKKSTGLPASSLLIEQFSRVCLIWFLATCVYGVSKDATLATIGLVAGEVFSLLFVLFYAPRCVYELKKFPNHGLSQNLPLSRVYKNVANYCIPVTANRLILTLLGSIEAILVPYMLTKTIHDETTALSIYGVLTGMALTFILFPSAITNSVAMMLLPTVSEATAKKEYNQVSRAAHLSLHYCLLLGIFCTGIFLSFGKQIGVTIFKDSSAGTFLTILSWLCPFIYISTTFNSILNGLGQTRKTLLNNSLGTMIRIFSILFLIPLFEIRGYLIGLLISYCTLALLNIYHVATIVRFHFHAAQSIIIPTILCVFSITFGYITEFCMLNAGFSASYFVLFAKIMVSGIIYIISLWLLRL